MPCLYLLTSPSGKQYVGITAKTAPERFLKHVKDVAGGRRNAIHRAVLKYGADAFKVQTLVVAEFEYLRALEKKVIDAFDTQSPNGYNLTGGGEKAHFWSAESREKTRQSQITSWKTNYAVRKAGTVKAIQAMQMACADEGVERLRRERISETMRAKGIGRGIANAAAKLDAKRAVEIRALQDSGRSAAEIGAQYGISRALVTMIWKRKRWAHA